MYSYVYSSIHPSIHIYIHPRFLLPLLREETRHRAKRSIVDAFPPFFRVETVSNPFPRTWHHFVFRRTSIVRIQCFTMCFVPVGIMKRVDAASSRRVVLSSRCSKERLKRRFRKVGSGFEVRDTVVSSERKRQLFQRAKLSYRERNTRRIPSRFVSLALQPYSRQRSRATLEERENGRHTQSSFSHVYVTLRSERKKEKNQDVRTSYMIKY